ncbi:MAG TPA: AAA family ATPase [Bryobacteraceae bacterium]|nr:AAA family ATPase [Bryobacteraceae bacterium]
MKLISLSVEHFRCIRKALVEFGPGLNVLHGPNDLGKSSLAAAIRAVLLLQASSREHEEFVNWNGSGVPHVELIFESEPQRIWRVRKTFASASQAFLEESRDGVDFHLEAKGREVDGRLSEILQWGLAPPGGKGRPKGMPMTFLSTALLAEQDRVSAIFDQALSKDSDDSGKQRLIQALQAVAEDPTYKMVLEKVQAQVDFAFTANGGKRRGKDSPWVRIADSIRQKEEFERQCSEQLQKTAAIEIELQGLHGRQLERRAAVEAAQRILEQMEAWHRAGRQREEILGRLQKAKLRLGEISGEMTGLAKAEQARDALAAAVSDLAKRAEAARSAASKAAQQAQAAKEQAARVQSEDLARERLLKRASLEKRQAELQADHLRTLAALDRIHAIQAASARLQTVERECRVLGRSLKDLEQLHNERMLSLRAAEEREASLRAVALLIRSSAAREALDKAETGLAQVNAWREEATRKRAAAAALEAALSAVPLPSGALLADLRQLDQQLQVASARLDVGLHVRIRPKRELHLTLRRDGAEPAAHDLEETPLEAGANHEIRIDIDKVAEIVFTGGAQTAREEMERLQKRWLAEVEPALERANAVNLDHLGRMVADAALRVQEVQEARRAAAQLDQRVADQPDWAGQRTQRQQEFAASEAALGQIDRAAAKAMARQLRIADLPAADVQLEKLRQEREKLITSERKLDSDVATANARHIEKQKTLAAAREELAARIGPDENWEQSLPQTEERQSAIQTEMAAIATQLESLTTESGQAVTSAKKAVDAAEKARVAAETASAKAAEELRAGEHRVATADGEIHMRREAIAKLDEAAARAAVGQVEAELSLAPPPPQVVTDERLADARSAVQAARDELRRIEDEIQAKRGALQHVGGEVARQRHESAQEALRQARADEHLKETEYAAWDLLRTTLLEAEREEGVHLGRALGDPIAKRFAELTERRYGSLSLGPDLETHAISAAGDARPVSALSVGTRDQLSTIFRLSLAERLQTALMLDDQLTQSDADRMLWLRDLIRELASNIQILVFTCRPADYLLATELKARKSDPGKPPVRSISLLQIIERSAAAQASSSQ